MPFDLAQFIDKGFTTMVAVAAVYFVIQLGRLFTQYIPKVLIQAKEFADIWGSFVKAVESNATSIDKNTQITDLNYKHSADVLAELVGFRDVFITHDMNALELKEHVMELVRVINEGNNSEEVVELLRFIIKKMEASENPPSNVRHSNREDKPNDQ